MLQLVFRNGHSLLEELIVRIVRERGVFVDQSVAIVHLRSHGLIILHVGTLDFLALLASAAHHSHGGPLVHPVDIGFLKLNNPLLKGFLVFHQFLNF